MADNQDPSKQNQDPPAEPTPEEAEKKYWDTFESRLDGWFDKKIDGYRKQGTSRTGAGRATLPKILADMIFGPPKD